MTTDAPRPAPTSSTPTTTPVTPTSTSTKTTATATATGDLITHWPARALVHRADSASCEVAAMQLGRCAAALVAVRDVPRAHSTPGADAGRVPGAGAQPDEAAVVAQALRELGTGLRDYGLEMSRLAAVERALADVVVDEADVLAEDMQARLHRLRSEAGRAAATIRHLADAVRARLDRLGGLDDRDLPDDVGAQVPRSP